MPFCDTTLSAEARAADLVSRMTLFEKGSNLGGAGGWGGSAGVPRLGVPPAAALQSSEALHGLVQASCGATRFWPEFGGNNTGCPASFPHALALGATFNRTLWGLIGDRISTEARAAFNTGHLIALWLWAPDINLFKDPRWGRGQEVPGEDPFLNGE
jgi:beta-glucosidase-like glycosyl hydrolase